MKRKIKFTHTGHSTLVGNFEAGDTFTGDAEACRHFVEDAQCAVWDDIKTEKPAPKKAVQAPERKRGSRRPKPDNAPQQPDRSAAQQSLQAEVSALEASLISATENDKPAIEQRLEAKRAELAALA